MTKIKSIVEQDPVSTNSTFLVWSDLTYDQPFSYVFSHFGHGNKHPNTEPGDPRVSLLLTSVRRQSFAKIATILAGHFLKRGTIVHCHFLF